MKSKLIILRSTILAFVITTITLSFNSKNNHSTMGMNYHIIPNKQTRCPNDFGNGLSFFFEQVGGYEEKAEVEQVSKILKLDLSVFQDIDYNYEDKSDIEKHWHAIETVSSLVDTFILKIIAQPDYYKEVHHNPADRNKQIDEESRLWQLTDTVERDRLLNALHQQPFYYYPPDYGYLSEGKLLKDLHTFKKTLECYKKNGVTAIRFEYM